MKVVDPLAQSFFVEESTGIFVTSVDLYFFSKDENLPVTIQLRPIELGLPTEKIYPFSEIVLEPKDVNISEDASVPTRVTFDSPIHLAGEKFHSIVLFSNSDLYRVWISRLGELNIFPESNIESNQTVITKQPLSGGLFKSQNSSSWNESSYEDLKFTLYRANFKGNIGNFNFYNPVLDIGNDQIAKLVQDPLEFSSRKIRVGLQTTIVDLDFNLGNTVIQQGSNASGNYIGSAGVAFGNLGIINPGIGYTPFSGSFTFNNVPLRNETGFGENATANITISNGVAISAAINNGGTGYSVGDVLNVLQIGNQSLGRNLQLSVQTLDGINQLILDNVQGDFEIGVGKTIQFINSLGITTNLNSSNGGNVLISSDGINIDTDGLHVRVNHKNHGMHAGENIVEIFNTISDLNESKLLFNYGKDSSEDIFIDNTLIFSSFENVGVSSTNPGYILIGDEIISYEGVTSNSLINITRRIDQTKSFSYQQGTPVYKYEINGISLRRINKVHTLQDSDIENSIDFDFYTLKIDTSSSEKTDPLPHGQIDRSSGVSFPKLYINETKSSGGDFINATQNIQYEIVRPNIQILSLNGTDISSRIRTTSGTSVNGTEFSFENKGFEDINLSTNNYFSSPRLVCSKVNENRKLGNLSANKSLELNISMSTTNSFISPIVDLDRVSLILISNRINSPIKNYIEDGRVSTLREDPSAFVYATNIIELELPATSIKILVAAYINNSSDLRAFYAVKNNPSEESIYIPFPGFNNLNNLGQIINNSLSDGSSDKKVPKTDILSFENNGDIFRDYEFTVDNLSSFRYFTIKLVGSSTNQAFPPRLKDLRVIALA